ncbi:hypothetical protein QR680_019436 [Steinernema hermaphroditum]|uniref:Uncharacterized protein n=1 Tax=Steinernema hermaphroditum TaxID=289476 RepID=A0AA39GQE2_9BILA|nr:hypothetical protein QR680_019436 [Steinernema hermaphroditum]
MSSSTRVPFRQPSTTATPTAFKATTNESSPSRHHRGFRRHRNDKIDSADNEKHPSTRSHDGKSNSKGTVMTQSYHLEQMITNRLLLIHSRPLFIPHINLNGGLHTAPK